MQATAHVNLDKGFTLIELMVSIVILLIVILSVMYSLSLYARHNMRNALRREAVRIAQECVERLRVGESCDSTVTKKVRSAFYQFQVNAPNPSTLSAGTNSVNVAVSYNFRNKQYNYTINTVIYK
ncbi:MAG: prepilin-type N-terminal cleavage/methylation domain-containing protein [Deltaproteobacteria bacterium]|nr:prepilin-type N-terminal cleavage/methylation domain-containing protein [Deltaproteobacteria bacterium]MBW2068691.1 prepilin-type N-terminal cleavage/methylation domain-containing protein [Deltaproteobacteria bacterium]